MGSEGASFDTNSSWNNGEADCAAEGGHDVSADPRFTDADAGDFSLLVGFSPVIDAGNPLSGYNDPDGSRNDMGAFGGPEGSGW